MSGDAPRPRQGPLRRIGRGIRHVVGVLDLVDAVVTVVRVVTAPFRLLARLLDSAW